ncbi:MAG TPA: DUF4870 domain-containing protein [Tepidisphaeraceae bacterium]|jgi:hypothetical protein
MTEGNSIPPGDPTPSSVPPVPPPVPPVGSVPYATPAGPAAAYMGPPPTQDDRTMAMLAHGLSIVSGFIGPLIIWLIKKDTSPFVDDQGKESLNFQLTLLIGYLFAFVTMCLIIGYFIFLAVWVCSIVFGILAAIEANKGVAYRYPFAIRIIK